MLPMRECQLMHLWLNYCHREQAPSHIWNCIYQVDLGLLLLWLLQSSSRPELSLVYSAKCGGLLPMRECQLMHLWLTHCHREQAPSHIWKCIYQVDLGLLLLWLLQSSSRPELSLVYSVKCGRGLAPDEGVSVDTSVAELLQSGASPLPHLELHISGRSRSAFALAFSALEPTGVGLVYSVKNVGGGLLPMRECQLMHLWLTHCHREQAPSHSSNRISSQAM